MDKVRKGLVALKVASSQMLVIGLGFAVARVLAFTIGVIIARTAGVSTFGEFTLFITVYVIVTELPNAIDITYIRFANSPERVFSLQQYLSVNLVMKAGYLVILMLLALLLSGISDIRGERTGDSLNVVAQAMAAGGIFSVFLSLVAYYQRTHDFVKVALLRALPNFLVIAAVGCFVVFKRVTLDEIVYAYFGAGLLLVIGAIFILRGSMVRINAALYPVFGEYWRICTLLLLSTMLSLVANRLDVFFINGHLDSSDLGYYGAALRLTVLVSLITSVTTTALTPRAPAAWSNESARRMFFAQALFYFLVQASVAVLVYLFMEDVVTVLFGAEYSPVAPVADILLLQVLFAALVLPFQLLIQCSDKPAYMVIINVLRLVLGMILLAVLVPMHGVLGAAVSVALTSLFMLICAASISRMLLSRKCGRLSEG